MSDLQIVIALYPGVTHLDFTGPHQVLCRTPGATVVTASLGGQDIEADGLRLAGWVANQVDPGMANLAENLATLRRWALNILKADTRKSKLSIKARIKAAGWDHHYLVQLLALHTDLDA